MPRRNPVVYTQRAKKPYVKSSMGGIALETENLLRIDAVEDGELLGAAFVLVDDETGIATLDLVEVPAGKRAIKPVLLPLMRRAKQAAVQDGAIMFRAEATFKGIAELAIRVYGMPFHAYFRDPAHVLGYHVPSSWSPSIPFDPAKHMPEPGRRLHADAPCISDAIEGVATGWFKLGQVVMMGDDLYWLHGKDEDHVRATRLNGVRYDWPANGDPTLVVFDDISDRERLLRMLAKLPKVSPLDDPKNNIDKTLMLGLYWHLN